MASITELLDKLKNARATVELVEACGKRVCSGEEHWDCPYGNEGMTDCVDRLEVAYEDTIENLLQLAEALSTADVEQEAHGRWVEDEGTYPGAGLQNNLCSVCGKIAGAWKEGLEPGRKWPYCPNCGAKMDGGAGHDKG